MNPTQPAFLQDDIDSQTNRLAKLLYLSFFGFVLMFFILRHNLLLAVTRSGQKSKLKHQFFLSAQPAILNKNGARECQQSTFVFHWTENVTLQRILNLTKLVKAFKFQMSQMSWMGWKLKRYTTLTWVKRVQHLINAPLMIRFYILARP